jgi:hydrogenase maturation protein HypF
MKQRLKIEVRGIVQGVGFRPFVYRLAQRLGLTGHVRNSACGIAIEVQGTADGVASFLRDLPEQAPPMARLVEIVPSALAPEPDEAAFAILESTHEGRAATLIAPDIASCADCVRELFDRNGRRFRYPFLNCTNCGPRFTITRSVPYDRAQTSMAGFTMCPLCQGEYDDPANRRFHAQPNACAVCGPQLELVDRKGTRQAGEPIAATIRLLRQGRIVSIKGLGGFHLAVDATQPAAVAELRQRKHRGEKPFALMLADVAQASQLCDVTAEEAAVLTSPQRPIVLLRRRSTAFDALAPDGNLLGVFLPYTPLHHLLVGETGLPALVMTSANLTDEPIAIDNQEALSRLGEIADFFLLHNRDILLRCDDSVVRVIGDKTHFARRSRGFVPSPIALPKSGPSILAVGGELKNAICLSRGAEAFCGQHIGDLESLSASDFFEESIAHFKDILDVEPETIAHDLHPAYLATQWAQREQQAGRTLRLVGVQHHHAHIAGCMVENQLTGPVIGVALDGTGFGTDGQAWGGEVLIAEFAEFRRAAHLAYAPMPGRVQCIHEPWRMAVSYLWQAFGEDWRSHLPAAVGARFAPRETKLIEQMLGSGMRLPLTSSCGRLFDAVAALALSRSRVSYEAQAAIALEACCGPPGKGCGYPFGLRDGDCLQIETAPMFAALCADLDQGVPAATISRRFHAGLIDALTDVVIRVARRTSLKQVCLSGGSFQNAHLLTGLDARLTAAGLAVFTQIQVPCGDGGLSLGQLTVAAATRRSNL